MMTQLADALVEVFEELDIQLKPVEGHGYN